MGIHLNPGAEQFLISKNSKIYIDKSGIINELNSFFNTEDRFVCVSRPRRFGKSMAANMISAYYDRTIDGKIIFSGLKILETSNDNSNMNTCDVIFVNMQEFLSDTSNIADLISKMKKDISWEITREYPSVSYYDKEDFNRIFSDVFAYTKRKFVIIIDEWDCIFREYKKDFDSQNDYLDFLRDWLKDKPYIGLAYMTGILPIKKYGSHSALNMFSEYSMMNAVPLDAYMGFTDEEVRSLCEKYDVNYDETKNWYDGYHLKNVGDIYSPRSVVQLMKTGIFDDYWNQTENFEALRAYIDMNFDGLKDSILVLMAGGRIKIDTRSFVNDMASFSGYQDVLTLLIHLGYLGYDFDKNEVFVPNREILMEFVTATSASGWDEIMHSVEKSERILEAIWSENNEIVAEGIEEAHLETSHIQYNDENALSYTISLALYAARQYYSVVREIPSGKGFADLVYIPRRKYIDMPAMVVELKWDKSANTAINQIKDKKYSDSISRFSGDILLVGINYDKKTKKHECIIEKFQK